MSRRRDHRPRFDTSYCPDTAGCARLYHPRLAPGDVCECCATEIVDPADVGKPRTPDPDAVMVAGVLAASDQPMTTDLLLSAANAYAALRSSRERQARHEADR